MLLQNGCGWAVMLRMCGIMTKFVVCSAVVGADIPPELGKQLLFIFNG